MLQEALFGGMQELGMDGEENFVWICRISASYLICVWGFYGILGGELWVYQHHFLRGNKTVYLLCVTPETS